jgi:DNA polymerase-4
MSDRVVFHVDMNAFFAAVEQRANPGLRGKPVAVVGARHRTVILTASYEARAFGVKTGLTVPEARRLCPRLILVPVRNDRYTDTCARLTEICRAFSPVVEVASIDELFLDVTGTLRWWASGGKRGQKTGDRGQGTEETDLDLARALKARIRGELGLTCSVGIAPNKLLAKLASDLQKPDGLVRIRPEEVAARLETLPVKELCGIGPRTTEALAAMGIRTCGELGRYPVEALARRFGVIGRRLADMGRGVDSNPVVPLEDAPDAKSVGHSQTLPRDITARADFEREILQLADLVGRRLRAGGYAGRTVALTLRYKDFTTFSRHRTLPTPTSCAFEIFETALRILDSLHVVQPVRMVGVSVGEVVRGVEQAWLFEDLRRRAEAERAMDAVNDRFGALTVTRARLLSGGRYQGSISPAWRPEGVHRVEYT